MIIVLLIIVGLVVLWFMLKNLMTAVGYLIGLGLILAGGFLAVYLAWHLFLWSLPYLIIGGLFLILILCGAKLLEHNRRHRHRLRAH